MRPENIQAWAEGVEFGHPPPLQPPFDQFGNPLPNTPKTGPSTQDAEAYLNYIRRQAAETGVLERASRQQKFLLQNDGAKDLKPEPRSHLIPRKSVPKSNDTIPRSPQAVLLRNGETKRIQRTSTYVERVRDLGYPEALFPLPMTEVAAKNSGGIDCTGAKVVKEKDDRQLCHQNQNWNTPGYSDGSHTLQKPFLTPETAPSSGEALALRPAQAAKPIIVPEATARLQHFGKPPTAHNTFTDHLDPNELRCPSVGSNLSRSNAARRPSNPMVERMAVPTGNVNFHDSRKG